MSAYSTHRTARGPIDAIRLFCLECQGSTPEHREVEGVKNCPSEYTCSLWRYRLGHNPTRKGIGCKGGKSAREEPFSSLERAER